jgi:hypothetical protein
MDSIIFDILKTHLLNFPLRLTYFWKTQSKEFRAEILPINRSNSHLIALKFLAKTDMPFLRYSIIKKTVIYHKRKHYPRQCTECKVPEKVLGYQYVRGSWGY